MNRVHESGINENATARNHIDEQPFIYVGAITEGTL